MPILLVPPAPAPPPTRREIPEGREPGRRALDDNVSFERSVSTLLVRVAAFARNIWLRGTLPARIKLRGDGAGTSEVRVR